MSGLVNGLQNRLRRFESARDLKEAAVKQFAAAFILRMYVILKKSYP